MVIDLFYLRREWVSVCNRFISRLPICQKASRKPPWRLRGEHPLQPPSFKAMRDPT